MKQLKVSMWDVLDAMTSHSDDIEKGRLELDIEALQLITEEATKLIKIHEELQQ